MRLKRQILLLVALLAASGIAVADDASERAKPVPRKKVVRVEHAKAEPRDEVPASRAPRDITPARKPREEPPERPVQPGTANRPRSEVPSRPATPTPPRESTPAPAPQPIVTPVPVLTPALPVVVVEPPLGPVRLQRCESALICALDPVDELVAWTLVERTGLLYADIALERLEGWTWRTVLHTLQLPDALILELLYELDSEASLGLDWSDADIVAIVEVALLAERVPQIICSDTFVGIPLDPRERRILPAEQLYIARSIADHTASCTHHLLAAYDHWGSWAEVALDFSLSPRLFSAVFGVTTETVDPDGNVWLEYPSDGVLFEAVAHDLDYSIAVDAPYHSESSVRRGFLQWGVVIGVAGILASLGS